jgi:rhodanese-related sulfurtransferase
MLGNSAACGKPILAGKRIDPRAAGPNVAGMDHSPGFLKVVNEARTRVKELTLDQARARLAANPRAVLLDVREDAEWAAGHAAEARHLGKGVLERDIEKQFPDTNTEIIMYCGGGYRSALTCDMAQRMGYRNVASLIGGYKALAAAGWPMAK